MKNKKFILLGVLLLMVLAPMVLALDFTNSIDNALAWAESNPRVASAVLLSFFVFAMWWLLAIRFGKNLGLGDESKGARVMIALVLATITVLSLDYLQTQAGKYLIPDYALVSLLIVLGMFIAFVGYGLMSKNGTTNLTLIAALVCLGGISLYHLLQKVLDNFPDDLGGWGDFLSIVYVILAIGLGVIVVFFIWNNLISGIRLKPRTPLGTTDMDNMRANYTQKQVKERLAESETEAKKARVKARTSRKGVLKMDKKIVEAQKILADLRRDVATKDVSKIKGKWHRKGKGRLHELETSRGIIRAYIGLISKLSNEIIALPGVNPAESAQLTVLGNLLLVGSVSLGEVITKITDELEATTINWSVLSIEIDKATDVLNRIEKNAQGATVLEEKMRTDLARH